MAHAPWRSFADDDDIGYQDPYIVNSSNISICCGGYFDYGTNYTIATLNLTEGTDLQFIVQSWNEQGCGGQQTFNNSCAVGAGAYTVILPDNTAANARHFIDFYAYHFV